LIGNISTAFFILVKYYG